MNPTPTQELMGILSHIWPGFKHDILKPVMENVVWVLKMYGQCNNTNQLVHFLAQCGHETDGFKTLKEYGSRTYFLERYGHRKDIKIVVDNEPKYIGRGLIMVTGKDNYSLLGYDDNPNKPEDLEEPLQALKASATWWNKHGCNELADEDNHVGLCRRINGGTNGLQKRINNYNNLKIVFREFVW